MLPYHVLWRVGGGGAQEASTNFESQSQHVISRQPSLDIFLYHEVQKFWEVLRIIIISVEEKIRISEGVGAEAQSPNTCICMETDMKPNVSKIYVFFNQLSYFLSLALLSPSWYWHGNTKNELQRWVKISTNIYKCHLAITTRKYFISPKSLFICQKRLNLGSVHI